MSEIDNSRVALSPLLLSMQVLGAVPMAPGKASSSILQVLYSAALLGSISYFSLSAVMNKYEQFQLIGENDSGKKTMEFMNTFIIAILFATTFLIFCFLLVNGTFFYDVLKRLDVICTQIKCGKGFYNLLYRYSWRYALLFWFSFIVILLEDSLFWLNILTLKRIEITAMFLVRVLHAVLELQMAALAHAIWLLFQLLNNQIRDLTVQLHYQDVTSQLEQLRHTHFSLGELTRDVSTVYQPVLLISLALLFLDVVDSCYFTLLGTFALEDSFYQQRITIASLSFSWSLVIYLRVLNLTLTCHRAHDQRNMTQLLVQKMEFTTKNIQVLQELDLFRDQFLHTGWRFSVFGATVGLPLLHAFHGGVTTYLVILLQFHTLNKQLN